MRSSGGWCFSTPNGKFAKFELLDASGNIIPAKPSAGARLLQQLVYFTKPTCQLGQRHQWDHSWRIFHKQFQPTCIHFMGKTVKLPATLDLSAMEGLPASIC